MKDQRPSRSDKYQYILKEITTEDKYLIKYNNSQSIGSHLNPFKYDEKLLDLQDQLMARVWEVIELICTEKQKEILNLYFVDGYTQQEISRKLKICQASVVKSMQGNKDYKYIRKIYGGTLPKLKKALLKDPIYLDLLKQIQENKEEKY